MYIQGIWCFFKHPRHIYPEVDLHIHIFEHIDGPLNNGRSYFYQPECDGRVFKVTIAFASMHFSEPIEAVLSHVENRDPLFHAWWMVETKTKQCPDRSVLKCNISISGSK